MKIPTITHLQFAILCLLKTGSTAGVDIREKLKTIGVIQSHPAFYQLMSRMEESGVVTGKYKFKIKDNLQHKERIYSITSKGLIELALVKDFYHQGEGSPFE